MATTLQRSVWALGILLLCTTVRADSGDGEVPPDVLEIVSVLRIDRLLEGTAGNDTAMSVAASLGRNRTLDPDTQGKLVAAMQDYGVRIQPELLRLAGGVIAEALSDDDLAELLAYYRSDLGSRSLRLMPQILAELWNGLPNYLRNPPDPEERPAASELTAALFAAMQFEQRLMQGGATLARRLVNEARAANPSLDEEAANRVRGLVAARLGETVPWLMADLEASLAEHFTLEEQRAMLDFARSEVSARLGRTLPEVMRQTGGWLVRSKESDAYAELMAEVRAIAGTQPPAEAEE